jgi:ankyrin repeat protein
MGSVEAVRVLLEAGADVNKRDSKDRTPLSIALYANSWQSEQRRQDKPKIAALLREAGAQEPQPHA